VTQTAIPQGSAPPAVALGELLLAMADDEFVLGFSDSEWTGIAPLLEEDVAMSSLAQDELGHAAALYDLLAELTGTTRDALAYDRQPDDYRHARLLDHGRGDWAMTVARRWWYETADAARLDALADGSWAPLRELLAKIRREEPYHRRHVATWVERLASSDGEARERFLAALRALADDGATVFTPLSGEAELLDAGIMTASLAEQERAWRTELAPTLDRLGLPGPLAGPRPGGRGPDHGPDFAWLHGEFTMVRRSDPGATW
jgi:ring-1,2-phenylacetyl-CoA epoxidase subunit PaaC